MECGYKLNAKTEGSVLVENQRTEWSRSDESVFAVHQWRMEIKAAAKGIAWADKRCYVCRRRGATGGGGGLGDLLEVAHRYSKRWSFQFKAAKCKVMANRKRREGA